MKIFLLGLVLLSTSVVNGQGISGSYIRLSPSTLPGICRQGDLMVDNSSFALNMCNGSNTWAALGSGGGGTWGSITGTLSTQTDLQSALNLKSPIASPTFTGTATAPTFVGALTGTASGNLAATPTNHGMLISSSTNTVTVLAPDASTTKVWTSGGASADPSWQAPAVGFANPMTTLGDFIYENSAPAAVRLAGNTTTTKMYLSQTGTGAISAVPSWAQIAFGDLSGTASLTSQVTGILPIANGGTGQSAKQAAFDALSPASATGDMIQIVSGHNVALGSVSANGGLPLISGGGTIPNAWGLLSPSGIGGNGGSKNYLSSYNFNTGNGNFELGATTGWTLGTIGTLTNGLPTGSPTFGSGASVNLSITTVTGGSQIAGTYSLSYVSSAATTAGNMVASSAFSIDSEDATKVQTVKFYYTVNSGASNDNFSATSSNSFAWAAYDVTNSSWLSSTGNFCMAQSSGAGYCTGTVQTNSNTASVRFAIYNANATAGATTIYFDDISFGPQTAPMGPAMGDSITFTPTGSWSTNTTYTGNYQRRGEKALITWGISLAGAPTSANLALNLPAGLVIDTTKLTNAGGSLHLVSGGAALHASTGTQLFALYSSSTSIQVYYLSSISTAALLAVTQAAPVTWASTDKLEISIEVPIVGWSSNSNMSSDTDTRVVAMQVNQGAATATITSSFSLLKFTATPAQDTHGAFSTSTGQYTVPVTGFYRASVSAFMSATYANTNQALVGVGKNSTTSATFVGINIAAAAQGALIASASGTIFCNAGDTLSPLVANTGGTPTVNTSNATANYFNVERLSGPSVITATESVNARYHSATATLTASLSNVTYTTKDFDSHNAYSGTTYTIPVSGKYQIQASLLEAATFSLGQANALAIVKNGSVYSQGNVYAGGAQGFVQPMIVDEVPCLTGDTIVIQAMSNGGTPTVSASAVSNYFSIERVGN